MKLIALASLLLAAPLTITGCLAPISAAPGESGAAETDLIFGIRAIGGVNGAGWTSEAQKRQMTLVHLVNERNLGNVDVIMRAELIDRGTHVYLETLSARTGEILTHEEIGNWMAGTQWRQTIEHLAVNYKKGTPLYEKIAAERDAAQPAAAGVTKAELQKMVSSAVAEKKETDAVRVSDVDAPSYKRPERPNDYAVIIGIEKYSDLPSAQYAERDAAAVRAHLAALGVPERNMVSLVGDKAGRAAFVKTFETWLPRSVGDDSTVWVYYSGHGAPDPRSGAAFLLPWDGDPQFLEDTAYPVKRLYGKLGELKAKRVLVALDACFSGAGGRSVLAKGLRPLVTKVDAGAVSKRTVALTASGADEVTGALDAQGHGLFTYHFLKGLNGAAADAQGRVSLEDLFAYLSPKVKDDARRQNRGQTPQLIGSADGVLIR